MQLDSHFKDAVKEKDRLKLKLIREANLHKYKEQAKTCYYCKTEYNEKENFNWSCRTHQSDWGGTLWWCCGKTNKDQPGCKFGKHSDQKVEGSESSEQSDQ